MNPQRLLSVSLFLGILALAIGCSGSGASAGSGGNITPTPAITSITPTSLSAGSNAQTITVTGSGFIGSSVIQVAGVAEATTYVSSTELTATVPASQLASGAQLTIVVSNGTVTSSSGAPVNLVVSNPSPTITTVSPSIELVSSTNAAITITGTGFVPTTTVNVNGTARTTAYASSTQVSVTLAAADLAATGTLSLTAVNPTPGGGTSPATSVAVNNPAPGSIQLAPALLITGTTTPTTVTVTGGPFVGGAAVQVNGTGRPTSYINKTTLTFAATVADQTTAATLLVTVTNPAPGGGTSAAARLTVSAPTATPTIGSVSPNTFLAGSPDSTIYIYGTGLTTGSVVEWNGAPLATTLNYNYSLTATVPAADLATAGTFNVTVNVPTATPSLSNAFPVTITNPPAPTLTSIYPDAGPINTATTLNVSGTGFTAQTTATINSQASACSFVSATQLSCPVAASTLALPGNVNVTVTTPAPGGGTTAPLVYTTYVAIVNNDVVYNAADGLLYVSVPNNGIGTGGNTVDGIDPVTGNIVRQIWVGSNPDKLALSTDGSQLFVGLDGAGAVAQVNLNTGKVVSQISLGGGPGIYNPPNTATYLAAVPGLPNSFAVAASNSSFGGNGLQIYDSGVLRTAPAVLYGQGPFTFGASASVIYMENGGSLEQLTVGASGVTGFSTLGTTSGSASSIAYDNGEVYLSSGEVFNTSTGLLQGTFYSAPTTPAYGPVVSDSTHNRAFIASTGFSFPGQLLAFNESTFNLIGSLPINNYQSSSYGRVVRWGQSGVALGGGPNIYGSANQLYIFQTSLVADLSSQPADLAVTLTAPSTATTGTPITWLATISNKGPNPASGFALTLSLDSTLILGTVTPSQGSCGSGLQFTCDLGSLANGASATVKVTATPSTAGTLAGVAAVSSTTYDPTATNDQATTSTVVTGALYGATPSIAGISPNLVQAGSSDVTLTVTGTGFNQNSVVEFGTTALVTAYVSSVQLTATVPAAEIATYGWGAVTVSNPSPGGGVSQRVPLTVYALVNIPASGMLFDPYSRLFYLTVPSTSTTLTGNSIVTLDPATTTIGTPLAVGSEPNVMAETSDGNYLYVGLSGANSLAEVDVQHQSLLATIPLNLPQYGTTVGVAANALATMPGSDTTLAVNTVSTWGNFGVLDVSGSTGTFRPNLSGIYSGVNPIFADASHLYAYDSQTSGAEFYRYGVNASGVSLIDGTTLDGLGGFQGGISLAAGIVYGAGGGIINPNTTPPSQIAVLPLFSFYEQGIQGDGVTALPDASLQKEFLMMVNTAGTWAYGLARYNLSTYTPEALLNMPTALNTVEASWSMFRFGQDGLALFTAAQSYSSTPGATEVLLLRGPFVSPQELTQNAAATLTSSSASSIAHGSGNTILTLTGTNFLPGVAVTWNGSYRTTTLLSATQVTINVPATDVASAGTASLVATNPGASSSSALQITIN